MSAASTALRKKLLDLKRVFCDKHVIEALAILRLKLRMP